MKEWLRSIPAIHELQNDDQFLTLMKQSGLESHDLTKQIKKIIEHIRNQILTGNWHGAIPGTSQFTNEIFNLVKKSIDNHFSYTLKKVINATGTILHTNLGRARLSEKAMTHVIETALNYSNLEYKLNEGERGSRHSHVEALIKELTGAEAAMIVNNNAAAVYLILRSLTANKEVIVSRGQLVEIGGSFRISSIMEESGAKLVEVGTTNKTHLYDYEKAVTPETAMVMKVHTSNFKVVGFTHTVETNELISFTKSMQKIIFYEDLGSGALFDFRKSGIGDEPVVKEIIELGADLVSFSGDKLLGGPQAGIIAGKKEIIDQLKKHQLARVVRVDKMTLAALEGTLMDYARGENEMLNIPTIHDLLLSKEQLEKRSSLFLSKLLVSSDHFKGRMFNENSQVGGGTMPEVQLPTVVIALTHHFFSAEQLAKKLRTESNPAVVARIQKDELILDLRTVSEIEEDQIIEALRNFN